MDLVLDRFGRDAEGLDQVTHGNDERRLTHDPVLTIDELREFRQRLQAVTRVRLLDRLLGCLPDPLVASALQRAGRFVDGAQQVLFGLVRVPDVERGHLGESGHRLSIGGHRRERHGSCVDGVEAVVARRDRETRGHTLHVVLERPRQRLVEIIQVEHQRPFRRRVHAEVRQVSVAAELDVQTRGRRVLEVGGHDLGRTPIERERRNHHASVTHRHQIRLPRDVLLLQQRNRIGTVRRRHPSRMTERSHPLTRAFSSRSPLLDARMLDHRHRVPPRRALA